MFKNESTVDTVIGARRNDTPPEPANPKAGPEEKLDTQTELIDKQIQILTDLERGLSQEASSRDSASDFVPRYFARASRNLHDP